MFYFATYSGFSVFNVTFPVNRMIRYLRQAFRTAETILRAVPYAEEIAAQAKLPLVCTTCRKDLTVSVPDILPVEVFVKPVWEE